MNQQKAIVCVDDEAIILMALRHEILKGLGGRFRVEVAINGKEALELIERLNAEGSQVTMVLTDWLMPGIKGDELVETIKRLHPEIHCILVSGQADARTVAQSRIETLLDSFVEKPWQTSRLIDIVSGCLG